MGKKREKNLSLFFRNLLIYILALLTPTLIIGCVVYINFFSVLKTEVLESNENYLNVVKSVIDVKINEIMELSYHVPFNSRLTAYALKSDPIEAIHELSSFVQTRDILNEVILYRKGDNILYSSQGTFTIENVDVIFQFENWDAESFYNEINSARSPVIKYIERNNQTNIFYITPLHIDSAQTSLTMICIINNDALKKMISTTGDIVHENILILSWDTQLISFLKSVDEIELSEIKKYIDTDYNTISQSIYFENNKYFLSIIKSPDTGLYYIRIIPEEIVLNKVNKVKLIMSVAIFLVVVSGVLIIYFGMHYNYKPIKDLAKLIEDKIGKKLENADEIKSINYAFNEIYEINRILKSDALQYQPALKEHFLSSLIRGHFISREKFQTICNNIGIKFTGKYFMVFSALLENWKSNIDSDIFIRDIENMFSPEYECQIKDLLFNNMLVAVLCTNFPDKKILDKKIEAVRKNILEERGVISTFGIGSTYDEVSLVGKSYLKSITALDYHLIRGSNCIIYSNEIADSFQNIKIYPKKEIEEFRLCIKSWNMASIEKSLDEIINHIRSHSVSLHTAKYIIYDIIYVFKKSVYEIDPSYAEKMNKNFDITNLVRISTIDEIFDTLKRFANEISTYKKNRKSDYRSDFIYELIDYIKSNYYKYDFQITSLADHFNVSPQHMRKLFKEYTDTTLSSYINNLKVERAKKILIDTNDSLDAITKNLGYVDVSSFIRKFRKMTGMTPGQYRTSHRNKI